LIELSANQPHASREANVKQWRGGTTLLRWVAAGILEAVKGFTSQMAPGNADVGDRASTEADGFQLPV